MSKLYFTISDIRKVVEDAKKATPEQRRATLGELLEAGCYDQEFKPNQAKIDALTRSLKPSLTLVHDDGIYLMPNAWFEGVSIAYAQGCDPQKDGDVWEHCRKLVGGDDFSEVLPLAFFQSALRDELATKVILHFTAKSIRFGVVRKRQK